MVGEVGREERQVAHRAESVLDADDLDLSSPTAFVSIGQGTAQAQRERMGSPRHPSG